jgi:single-stranded-DNA-specific exonuclease
MIWNKKPIASENVREMAEKFGLSFLEASILLRRGIYEPEEMPFYLEKDLSFLNNPFLFDGMEDAVDRVLLAKEDNEKVYVFGDRDVDGITSTTLMVEILRDLDLDPLWGVPLGDDSYGLTREKIQWAASQEVSLLITVDCGISNKAEIALATELGMDVIVLDHHEGPAELPPALVIINPKLEGEAYPFPSLAACGVVSKLAWAIKLAQTDLYNQSFTLLHSRRTEEKGLLIEAVRIRNLLPYRRFSKTFTTNSAHGDLMTLADFLQGQEILVFGAAEEKLRLQSLFGSGTDIHLTDFSSQLGQVFPPLAGLSWERIKEKSRLSRYKAQGGTDLDVLTNLLLAFLRSRYKSPDEYLISKLDLVALGTLADLMPIRGENRILVGKGLEQLGRTARPGVRSLLAKLDLLGKDLTTQTVSWQIAPAINSTGRLGVPDLGVKLFLSQDSQEQNQLAAKMLETNKERRSLSTKAWDAIYPKLAENAPKTKNLLVQIGENIPRGVTGMLAARSVNTFGFTSMIVCRQENRLIGSLRAVKGFPTLELLESLQEYFLDFGGHAMAAGFSMESQNWEAFSQALGQKVSELQGIKQEEEVLVDAELPAAYCTPELWDTVEGLEPYGEGFRPLVFVVREAVIQDYEFLGAQSKHLKMLVQFGNLKWGGPLLE